MLRAQTPIQTILAPKSKPAPAEQAPSPASNPPPVQAVALPQIADQAEQLERMLREVSKTLESVPKKIISDHEATARAQEIVQRARETEDLLDSIPNVMQLQEEDRYWRAFDEEYNVQRKLLTARAAEIEEKVRWLDTEQKRWQATMDAVRAQSGPEVVQQRVQQELDSIQRFRSEAQEQLNQILTLQNRIYEQDAQISEVLRKVAEARERQRGKLFERDSYPLWATRELRFSDQSITMLLYASADRGFGGASNFLRASKVQFIWTAVLYLVLLITAFQFRNHLGTGERPGLMPEAAMTFARPFSVALLVTLLATIGITHSAPPGVSFVVCLLYVVPVFRLLPALTEPRIRKALYAVCVFYVLEWTHLVLQLPAVFKRELFAAVIFLALTIFAWLTRPSRLTAQALPSGRRHILMAGIRIGLALLAASLIANILGFVSLSQVLGVGTLFSAFGVVLLYMMVRVLQLAIATLVNSVWFRSLPEARSEALERWGHRFLVIGAALLWLNISLSVFAIRDSVIPALESVLRYQVGFGKLHVTLGGTLSLVFLLLLGYAVANVASFILGSVLLPRVSLKGGMAYAISRVTYYILLVGLFFAALASAGLELNKFTVITGALGVGVGFGLQNIVNNFASGLIILFERPIRISDTVEVAGVTGTVRRIGARSSTVLTAQGAEVIIPNSDLLSNKVTNWTLSSTRRRVEVSIGVSYGADPELVIKLLTEIATSNSRVLTYPPPQTSFLGFGESALNFELTFWAAQAVWFDLKSEIGLEVLRALRNAGIEIPYPQRDLRIRSVDAMAQEEVPAVSQGGTLKQVIGGR